MPSPTEYYPLSLHDALPICLEARPGEELRQGPHRDVTRESECNPDRGADARAHAVDLGDAEAPLGQHLRQHDQRSEEHTSELQSHSDLVCRLLLEKKN